MIKFTTWIGFELFKYGNTFYETAMDKKILSRIRMRFVLSEKQPTNRDSNTFLNDILR